MNINATLLGQMITFALFVGFTMKFVWPPIIKALEGRQAKIADGIAAGERGRKELEMAQERSKQILREAKLKAQSVIEHAEKQAGKMVEEAKDKALVEHKRIMEATAVEAKQLQTALREQLRSEVAALAVAGAEKILARSLNEAANKDFIDDLVANL